MFSLQKLFDTKIAIVNKTKVFLKLIGGSKIIEYAAYFSRMCFRTNVYVKLGRFWNCNLCAHAFNNCNSVIAIYSIYLFINYKTITIDHVLGAVSQTRVSGGNRTHDPHANTVFRQAFLLIQYSFICKQYFFLFRQRISIFF